MDTTLQDPLVGRELDGRYLVRSRIARGGMATVYLALDHRLDRDVAIKVMHAHLAGDAQFTDRFVREAKAAARLSHPNVVQVFDQGAEGDLLYLAMEYLPGRTLREVLDERRVLTPREALTVFEPVLDALAAAHRAGLVHRDVKPENVILTDDGRVKVADFGLARAAAATTSTTGVLIGTVAYLAPELVLRGSADERGDVYAAGIMLFEMLTGRLPFTGPTPIQVAYQHVNDQVPAPSTLVPGFPAELDAVILAATAREPDDRPADAGQLLAELRSARARLTTGQLDARPDLPAGQERSAVPGAATEVLGEPARSQHTRALPGLAQRPGPAVTATNPPGPAAAEATRDGASATAAAPGEDAVLAALLRRRRVIGVSALAAVLALAVVLAGAAWYFAAGPGSYTATPRVIGLQAGQAADALRASGLDSTQVAVFDPSAAVGVVVDTDPAPGRQIHKNGTVRLQVSRGPEFVKVPAVVGLPETTARTALQQAQLSVGETTREFNDQPKGQVVAVSPAAGTQVRNSSSVTLRVSKGPEPVDVPDLTGRSKEDAEKALAALRLVPGYGPAKFDDTVPEGSVLSQTPTGGTLLPGQTVTLVLSKGPVLVSVPDVVGMQYAKARDVLQSAGFSVERFGWGAIFDTVRFQRPGAGSMARKGSTIKLAVL